MLTERKWGTTCRVLLLAAGMLLSSVGTGFAQPLVSQVTLVAAAAAVNTPLPADANNLSSVTFTVSAAGSYSITVTDLEEPLGSALAALNVSVATPTGSVAQVSAAGTTKSQSVTLAVGTTYTITPLATAAAGSPGGSFSVAISGPGTLQGTFTGQDVWAVSAASASLQPGQAALSTQFKVTDAGNYTLTLSDDDFPVALSSVQLIVLDSSGNPVAPTLSYPGTTSEALPSLATGTYDLFVIAQAAGPANAGLYGLRIVGGSSGTSVAFDATEPVGSVTVSPITIKTAGTVDLEVNDLAYPAALGSFQALAAEGSSVLANIPASTGSTPVPLSALIGTVQVYVLAQPGGGGQGSYAVYATESGTTLTDVASPVLDSTHYGYAYATPSLAAGSYQFDLHDYQVPQMFASLSGAVEQQGALVANSQVQSTGTIPTFSTAAGAANILVFPALQAAGDDSLFGVVLSALGVVAFNTTQGVGSSFSSTNVTIPASGNYSLEVTDLGFTASFSSLFVILTSGQTVTNEIIGAGEVPITVNAAGTYVLNVLAQPGAAANYGLYGLQMTQAQAPTVTLTANPTTVAAGAQSMLTWSSSNATSCSASGGWSGSLATSGSQQSPAISKTTTFVINCTGVGGNVSASAIVTVNSSSGGGGGAFGADTLCALLALASCVLWRRTYPRPL